MAHFQVWTFIAIAKILESKIVDWGFEKTKRRRKLREEKGRLKIVFVCVDPSMWRYTELIERLKDDFETVDVAIASFGHSRIIKRSSTLAFLEEHRLDAWVPRLFSLKDIKRLHSYDLVFTNHPYSLLEFPASYRTLANSGARILYSPYSLGVMALPPTMGKHSKIAGLNGAEFLWESDFHRKNSEKFAVKDQLRGSDVGFPGVKAVQVDTRPSSRKKIVAFAPHWISALSSDSLSKLGMKEVLGVFEEILDQNLADMVFRPHPRFIEHFERNAAESDKRLLANLVAHSQQRFEVSMPQDFIHNIDVLVHNSGSFLAEFALTGKPCYWLGNEELESQLNEFGAEMLSCHFKVEGDFRQKLIRSLLQPKSDNLHHHRSKVSVRWASEIGNFEGRAFEYITRGE